MSLTSNWVTERSSYYLRHLVKLTNIQPRNNTTFRTDGGCPPILEYQHRRFEDSVIAPSMPREQRLANSKWTLSLPKTVQQELQNSERKFKFPVQFRPTKYHHQDQFGGFFEPEKPSPQDIGKRLWACSTVNTAWTKYLEHHTCLPGDISPNHTLLNKAAAKKILQKHKK